MTLTILGLGPGDRSHRTREAEAALESAERILLRTGVHPGLDDLLADPRVCTCDDLYESIDSFEAVYKAIIARALEYASQADLVFAVPGNPLVGERTVSELLRRAKELGVETRVIPGISAIDVLAIALDVDPMAAEAQIIDATELQRWLEREPFNGGLPDVSPTRPVLLAQVYSPTVASAAKLALTLIFPDQHPITVIRAAGVPGAEQVERRSLFELDRCTVDHLTSVWIEPLTELDATRSPMTLHRIAARLRAPDGCPWDRKQSHASLRDTAIDEAYEVASAIDDGDPDHVAEELGDLLLHVAMQAQIADEAGTFSIGDVFDHVNRKLVRRHPHVFGDVAADTPEAVVRTWNDVKAQERVDRGDPANDETDPFDRLPKSMPVMRRIAKLSRNDPSSDMTEAWVDLIADELLERVTALSSAGIDPEVALKRAYRRSKQVVAASGASSARE
jgi:tetrapyrrole methylase family protein / MazG family protein